jgi:hypothetical protein
MRELARENEEYEKALRRMSRHYSTAYGLLLTGRIKKPQYGMVGQILGFDLEDIRRCEGRARKLKITENMKAWFPLAEKISVVFCGDIGEVIRVPNKDHLLICMQSTPAGRNILVCPLRLLKRYFVTLGKFQNGAMYVDGDTKYGWIPNPNAFVDCRPDTSCMEQCCFGTRLQRIEEGKVLKKVSQGQVHVAYKEWKGTVCFGAI